MLHNATQNHMSETAQWAITAHSLVRSKILKSVRTFRAIFKLENSSSKKVKLVNAGGARAGMEDGELQDGQPGVHEVNTILAWRRDKDGEREYRVSWVGFPDPIWDTWQSRDSLNGCRAQINAFRKGQYIYPSTHAGPMSDANNPYKNGGKRLLAYILVNSLCYFLLLILIHFSSLLFRTFILLYEIIHAM
jgi:hypothetical protein